MSKYITLVFKYETENEIADARNMASKDSCRAWSIDHEILRVDLVSNALEENDIKKAKHYISLDGVNNESY